MLISTHILDRVAARYHLRNGFSIVEFTMKKLSLQAMFSNPWIRWGVGLSLVAVAVFFYPKWWPALNGWIDGTVAARKESMREAGEGDAHSDEEHDHAHEEDGHDHAGHDESA
jgi:ABC-type nickel/cobalt efflux system permease component RcnA